MSVVHLAMFLFFRQRLQAFDIIDLQFFIFFGRKSSDQVDREGADKPIPVEALLIVGKLEKKGNFKVMTELPIVFGQWPIGKV